jgi:hypothetical protein
MFFMMKWFPSLFLSLVLLISFLPGRGFCFDTLGLQPVSPHGVFSTFSAESNPKQKYSFELSAESSIDPDFFRYALKGSYGISDNVELSITIPYVHQFLDYIDGLEDTAFGVKHRVYDEGKYGPSIAYLIHASISTGREDLSSDGKLGIGLIISKRISPFRGHFNIFYARPGDSSLEDEIILSGGIELSIAHNVSMLGEIHAKKSHFSDEYDQIEARLGYRIKTTDSIYTNIGLGFDLKNRSPEYRIIFSVGFVAPYERKQLKRIYEEE